MSLIKGGRYLVQAARASGQIVGQRCQLLKVPVEARCGIDKSVRLVSQPVKTATISSSVDTSKKDDISTKQEKEVHATSSESVGTGNETTNIEDSKSELFNSVYRDGESTANQTAGIADEVKQKEKVERQDTRQGHEAKKAFHDLYKTGSITPDSAYFKDEIKLHFKPKQLHYQLRKYLMDKIYTHEARQLLVLKTLKGLRKVESAVEIVKQDSFVHLEIYIENGLLVSHIEDSLLLELLDIFFEVQRNDEGTFGDVLLNEAVWRIGQSTIKQKIDLLNIVKGRATSAKRKKLETMAEEHLSTTVGEMSNPADLISLMYMLGRNEKIQEKLEEEAQLLVEVMSPVELYRLFYLLARNKRTSCNNLITDIKNKLKSKPIRLEKLKLKNLFFSCVMLRVYDKVLLTGMSEQLIEELLNDAGENDLNTIVLPVLTSCFRLGWGHGALMDCLMNCVKKGLFLGNVTTSERLSLVIGLGKLNKTEYADMAIEIAGDLESIKDSMPERWLDMVSSLAMIRKADAAMVKGVLDEKFYHSVLHAIREQPVFREEMVKTSLLNLLGYLHVQLGESHSIPDSEHWCDKLHEKVQGRGTVGLAKVVGEALSSLAPLQKYTNRNIVTKYGHEIDFELFVDETGLAKRLESVDDSLTRVWIKVQGFKDFIKGGESLQLSGAAKLAQDQLLHEHKYTVFVPYDEWLTKPKKFQQIDYLDRKIKQCIHAGPTPDKTTPEQTDTN